MQVDTTKFTYEEQVRFIDGWSGAGGITSDLEEDSPAPWCCPWHWEPVIRVNGSTPEEWGADWWLQCKPEVERILAEEG